LNITPALLTTLRAEINAALAEVSKRHGLTLKAAGASYTANTFTIKIEGQIEGGLSKEGELYTKMAGPLGLPALGTTFVHSRRTYKMVGLNTTGSKVLCERDGEEKRYLVPTDDCIRLSKAASAS